MDVKICGLTRPDDVALAVALGASHVGFNCSARSPRRVDFAAASELRSESGRARRVGVFVDESPEEIRRAVEALELEILQIHRRLRGPDLEFGLPVVAVCRVSAEGAALPESSLLSRCHALLFDSADPREAGGTGNCFDWGLISAVRVRIPRWLAGGLRSNNVAAAIESANPDLVDVASGVESSPGVKDRRKMEAFFRAVRAPTVGTET